MKPILLCETHGAIISSVFQKAWPDCNAYIFGRVDLMADSNGIIIEPCLNVSHTTLYYSIVFTSSPNHCESNRAAKEIRNQTGGKVGINILLHRPKALGSKSGCAQWFYNNVLREGTQICKGKRQLQIGTERTCKRNVEQAKAYWSKCEAAASFHLYNASSNPHEGVGLLKIAELHRAVHFVALGMIRVYLGYTANNYNLKHLLDLTRLFSVIVDETFPTCDANAQKRLALLLPSPNMIRHWDRLEIPNKDFSALLCAVNGMFSRAQTACVEHLKELTKNQSSDENPG